MNRHSSHTTAVLVFALSSREELRRKKIVKGEKLFDALTQYTLQTVKKTGLPIFHITEDQQSGSSFGERFTNAIQDVFERGFENIITIGNDSPHLSKSHIATALSNLEDKKSVIGPSADGGFYLMGLHRSDFVKSDFKKLPWQTSQLKEEILSLLSDSKKEVTMLPTLFDIDTIWDAKIISKNTSVLARNVAEAIISLITSIKKIAPPLSILTNGFYSSTHYNKGSPLAIIS